jgi:hypothetical protein
MIITLYVHEFHLEVGHTRAMIELINGLEQNEKDKIKKIEIVAYEYTDPEIIFPDLKCIKKVIKVPFKNLKPFLIKAIFFNIFSLIHSVSFAKKNKKISIGIANWNADIVNVQFIHKQWEDLYFTNTKLNFIKSVYKRILFFYFYLGELYVYKRKNTDYIAIANFIKQSLITNFSTVIENIHLIPSGVNFKEFNFSQFSQNELNTYLKNKYPEIKDLDSNKPIVLFVGAFERKGLDRAIKALALKENYQFIIIGKPEIGSDFVYKNDKNHFHINFTKEINLFYELSDFFIFPTRYEPFGLVIIEAYIMGLDIIVPNVNVGASEIIPVSEGVYFIDQNNDFTMPELKKNSISTKKERREIRQKNIEIYNWKNASKKFQSILFKN